MSELEKATSAWATKRFQRIWIWGPTWLSVLWILFDFIGGIVEDRGFPSTEMIFLPVAFSMLGVALSVMRERTRQLKAEAI